MSSLYVIKGRDQGRRFNLNGEVVKLGRDASNTLRLQDTEVSRSHAELRFEDNQWVLVDLGSSNGSFVNGQEIRRATLHSGDRVQLGRSVMLFTRSELQPAAHPERLVSIVESVEDAPESRIVSRLGKDEGSQLFALPAGTEPDWLAQARSNLQVMYRTALAVSHTLDIDELLERILELIFEWVGADRGCIMLRDEESDHLVPKALRARRPGVKADQLRISRTILDYVMKQEEGVLTTDVQEDQRWDDAASILSMGVHEAICVPMQGRYGIVGVIYIDTHSPPAQLRAAATGDTQNGSQSQFTSEHLKLMAAIGHQAALAVEDTSYYSAMLQSERLAAVGQTVATLSHHIKNILQGIRGGSYLIEEGLKDQNFDVVRQGWKIVERNQDRISNMVMDMLSFSKEREPEIVPSDLHELLEDVVGLARGKAADAGVELNYEPFATLPPVGFDYEALHRAVLNVLTNAVEACQGRGDEEEAASGLVRVEVIPQADRQRVMIAITDNGAGIPVAEQERIFRAFESSKGSRGTGLGLPVSRKILQEHGGDIAVKSREGEGSRFELILPWQPETRGDGSQTLSAPPHPVEKPTQTGDAS